MIVIPHSVDCTTTVVSKINLIFYDAVFASLDYQYYVLCILLYLLYFFAKVL